MASSWFLLYVGPLILRPQQGNWWTPGVINDLLFIAVIALIR
jgi:hypothetical protein